jgi:hypothetical protein
MSKLEYLVVEIEKWSEQYDLSFQFWGAGNNNLYISKDNVELYDTGGYESIEDVLEEAVDWIEKHNPRGIVTSKHARRKNKKQ